MCTQITTYIDSVAQTSSDIGTEFVRSVVNGQDNVQIFFLQNVFISVVSVYLDLALWVDLIIAVVGFYFILIVSYCCIVVSVGKCVNLYKCEGCKFVLNFFILKKCVHCFVICFPSASSMWPIIDEYTNVLPLTLICQILLCWYLWIRKYIQYCNFRDTFKLNNWFSVDISYACCWHALFGGQRRLWRFWQGTDLLGITCFETCFLPQKHSNMSKGTKRQIFVHPLGIEPIF